MEDKYCALNLETCADVAIGTVKEKYNTDDIDWVGESFDYDANAWFIKLKIWGCVESHYAVSESLGGIQAELLHD